MKTLTKYIDESLNCLYNKHINEKLIINKDLKKVRVKKEPLPLEDYEIPYEKFVKKYRFSKRFDRNSSYTEYSCNDKFLALVEEKIYNNRKGLDTHINNSYKTLQKRRNYWGSAPNKIVFECTKKKTELRMVCLYRTLASIDIVKEEKKIYFYSEDSMCIELSALCGILNCLFNQ